MERVTSADGTLIAFDRLGDGPPVVLVTGALADRTGTGALAERLAPRFTVLNYDRRGRTDSDDRAGTPPFAVEREIEDLAAVIAEAGGEAAVYAHSSGGALAVRAAAAGLPITRLILHEPPFAPDTEEQRRSARSYAEKLADLLAGNRRRDALAHFLTTVGMPAEMVAEMSEDAALQSRAHTLAYDSAAMDNAGRGGTAPFDIAATVTVPALVLDGGASPEWMVEIGRRFAAALPHGRHQVLAGQGHVVPAEILAPVVAEFFA
jgi:pimeloyl-ACP methyl ester carboxylesterase